MALVAAAIDVTCRAALNVGVGSGCEFVSLNVENFSTEEVVKATGTAAGVDILLHLTTEHGNVCAAIDIAAELHRGIAQAASISIALDDGAFVDDDVGVVFRLAVQLGCRLVVKLCPGAYLVKIGKTVVGIVCPFTVAVSVGDIVVAYRPGIIPVGSPSGFQLGGIRNPFPVGQRPLA